MTLSPLLALSSYAASEAYSFPPLCLIPQLLYLFYTLPPFIMVSPEGDGYPFREGRWVAPVDGVVDEEEMLSEMVEVDAVVRFGWVQDGFAGWVLLSPDLEMRWVIDGEEMLPPAVAGEDGWRWFPFTSAIKEGEEARPMPQSLNRSTIKKMKSTCSHRSFSQLRFANRCSDLPDLKNPWLGLMDDRRWISLLLGHWSDLKKINRVHLVDTVLLIELDRPIRCPLKVSSPEAMDTDLEEHDGQPNLVLWQCTEAAAHATGVDFNGGSRDLIEMRCYRPDLITCSGLLVGLVLAVRYWIEEEIAVRSDVIITVNWCSQDLEIRWVADGEETLPPVVEKKKMLPLPYIFIHMNGFDQSIKASLTVSLLAVVWKVEFRFVIVAAVLYEDDGTLDQDHSLIFILMNGSNQSIKASLTVGLLATVWKVEFGFVVVVVVLCENDGAPDHDHHIVVMLLDGSDLPWMTMRPRQHHPNK
ncbi:hypothetical protein ACLOJK_007021 [Asimina triloba]